MALLFTDSFDHYATADGTKKWNTFGTGVSIQASSGRRSTGCMQFSGNTRFADKTLPSSYQTLIVGFALDAAAGNTTDIMRFLDGATVHTGLYLTANNAIAAFRGTNATVLGTSANNVVPASGFCYIEVKTKIDDSTGTVEVKVNGVVVTADLTGNSAIVSGLQAGDKIEWTTDGVHDRVLIEGVAGKFDIGGFGASQPQPTPDQKLDFVVQVIDGDTDVNTDAFSIGIDGTGINDDGVVVGVVGVP